MTREQKINFFVVPISAVLAIIITVVLVLTKQDWKYYLIGVLLGLMTHGMMVKQNARLVRLNKLDPNHTTFNPRKSAILWFLLRFLLVAGVLVVLGLLARNDERTVLVAKMLVAGGGYVTVKIVFIILLLTMKKKEVDLK
ncbi:MAG: hypothetical protein IJU60_04055 [Acholeplasmatales bacterium]|nr:hypothetical protein [Acholeplasmatales bacterium]